jgi:hypothetical protein
MHDTFCLTTHFYTMHLLPHHSFARALCRCSQMTVTEAGPGWVDCHVDVGGSLSNRKVSAVPCTSSSENQNYMHH